VLLENRPSDARRQPGRSTTTRWLCFAALALGAPAEGGEPTPERKVAASEREPTYARDVQPLLQAKCSNCHQRGRVGPFALMTYEQAKKRAFDIASVVDSRTMPPWKADPDFGPRLKHDPSLTRAEIALLHEWAEANAPRGEPASQASPTAAETSDEDDWLLGKPDIVLEMSEEFVVPASGPDIYRCFVLPSNLSRDVYVSAVEFRPGNRRVVHHMMGFIDVRGGARARDAAESGPGYASYSGAGVIIDGELGGYAAGNQVVHLPEGVGRFLPRGSDIVVQIHYHPTGKVERDRSRVGLHLCRKPVRQTIEWANATNDKFRLPPGESNIEVKASWFVPVDVEALGVTPHMHELGRDFRMTAALPGGKVQDLIYIPQWDPSWQSTYYFEERVPLPKGTTVHVVAHYDNSAHARNPHRPPRLVGWGPDASDEMCVGYIGVVKKGQDLTRPGERDDLYQILAEQYMRKLARERSRRR